MTGRTYDKTKNTKNVFMHTLLVVLSKTRCQVSMVFYTAF